MYKAQLKGKPNTRSRMIPPPVMGNQLSIAPSIPDHATIAPSLLSTQTYNPTPDHNELKRNRRAMTLSSINSKVGSATSHKLKSGTLDSLAAAITQNTSLFKPLKFYSKDAADSIINSKTREKDNQTTKEHEHM